ncbi:hypothetical protein MUK42_02353 [Musa troglodytarum]|uniref:Uncharacterized protein n=1 Tax=Musa troglodytarum TaxID=320322 RepID=A0A9E7JHX8_9LILI|nr:hypothetical protein MUK42_02353 [Musa troglodytarum]
MRADMREGGIIAEADGLERHRGIEHDGVNARELLEEGDEDGHGELRPILHLNYVAPRVLDRLRLLAARNHVLVLLVAVIGVTDPSEHRLGLLFVTTLDEGVGSVREERRAYGGYGGRHSGQGQADTPPQDFLDLSSSKVEYFITTT